MPFHLGRALVLGFACIALSWSVAAAEMSPPLMSAAECIERVLRATPGVTMVEINVEAENGSAYPVIAYSSANSSGRRRFTELRLFEISGAQHAFIFDRSDIENDPIAGRLLPVWNAQCHAGYGFLTSPPG